MEHLDVSDLLSDRVFVCLIVSVRPSVGRSLGLSAFVHSSVHWSSVGSVRRGDLISDPSTYETFARHRPPAPSRWLLIRVQLSQ